MNYKIVNIRAIAIIAIVLGHSIILYSSKWGIFTTSVQAPILSGIKDVINTFQLELFFALSGFLFYKSVEKKGSWVEFAYKKAIRLIIPYFLIAFFWMDPFKIILSCPGFKNGDEIGNSIINQMLFSGGSTGHLWFLPTLFGIFIVWYFYMTKIHRNRLLFNALLVLMLLVSYVAGVRFPNYLQLNNTLHYSIFFFMGYALFYVDKHYNLVKYKYPLLFCCLLAMYLRSITIYSHLIYIALLIIVLYTFIPNKTTRLISLISENAFGIYLFHSPLIYITFTYFKNFNPLFVVLLNFIIFGYIALFITKRIRKTKFKFIVGE